MLHAPQDIAGQLALAAHALRLAGVDAVACSQPHRFDYGVGPDVVPGRQAAYVRDVVRLAAAHDVLHFHFGLSFLSERRGNLDARVLAPAREADRRDVPRLRGAAPVDRAGA